MPLPPTRDHRVTLGYASALTRRHREAASKDAERGSLFHAKAVEELLAQAGCAALRIYHGRNADGSPALVLIGVDADGDDMTEGIILEWNYPCPPFCGGANDLNP
jgi:hypothetical protein